MDKIYLIIGFIAIMVIVCFKTREGMDDDTLFYNSGIPCDEFCAKIKNEKSCTLFNGKDNTQCLNTRGNPVIARCYKHKNNNCMSMV